MTLLLRPLGHTATLVGAHHHGNWWQDGTAEPRTPPGLEHATTGSSIRTLVKTIRRYHTIHIQAGDHVIPPTRYQQTSTRPLTRSTPEPPHTIGSTASARFESPGHGMKPCHTSV